MRVISRETVLQKVVGALQNCRQARAVWEGGSAANAASDQFSDLDINILASDPIISIFEAVENTLNSISKISHIWNEPKSLWPELIQKVYFLKDTPRYFL